MGKKHRILVVDDDQDILDLLKYNLEKDGFKTRIEVSSERGLMAALRFHPDLIILDIMMSGMNGIELCKILRSKPEFRSTYIFFLTANSEQGVHKLAIDTGGDELIEKIIGLRELSTKIKAVLQEKWVIHKHQSKIRIGDLLIDRKAGEVFVGDRKIILSEPEFELLFFFAQNPRKFIHSKKLLENLWGSNIFSAAQSLKYYLDNLSKKLDNRLKQMAEDTYALMPGKRSNARFIE